MSNIPPALGPAHNPYRLLGSYRALLALLVLVSHTNMWLPLWVAPLALGNVGVLLFFVLSGFVIAEACDVFYPGKPQRFLLNRFLRIYPTYWAACGVAIAIYAQAPSPELNLNFFVIFANLSIVLAERLPPGDLRLISVIWAVGIELRFYVLAALVDYLDRFLSQRGKLQSGHLMCIAGVIFLILYVYTWQTGFNRFAVIKFAPFFMLGFIYYRCLRYKSQGSFLFGVLVLLASLHSYILYNSVAPETDIGSTALVFVTGLVLFAGMACVSRAHRKVERVDKRLGDLTYSIYLVHWPIVYAVDQSDLQGYTAFFTVLGVSIILSILIGWTVEKPFLRLRDSIRRTKLYA